MLSFFWKINWKYLEITYKWVVNRKRICWCIDRKIECFFFSLEPVETGKWLSIRRYVDIFTQNSCKSLSLIRNAWIRANFLLFFLFFRLGNQLITLILCTFSFLLRISIYSLVNLFLFMLVFQFQRDDRKTPYSN